MKTREQFIEWLHTNYPTPDSRSERYIKKRDESWWQWIIDNSSFIDEGCRFKDRLAAAYLGLTEQPKCVCGRSLFAISGHEWRQFCCVRCSIEYGRQKLKQDFYSDSEWRKNQATAVSAGIKKKYGVDNPMHIPGVGDKIKENNNKNFGADYHTQTIEGRMKISSGRKAMFQTEEGLKLREATRQRIIAEFERAEKDGDSTYMDKGKVGGKSSTELRFKSMIEDIIGEELSSKYIKTPEGYREIDIFIPNLNVGIEFNGLYSHSEEGGKNRHYHKNKVEAAESLGIRLFTIWEDEFLDIQKQSIWLNRIKAISGNTKTTYARKTIIDEIPPNEYYQFLETNHIQGGSDRVSIRLGLRLNGKLIAVMGFKACANNVTKYGEPKDVWDLARFATNGRVIGGFSKLLNYFQIKHNPRLVYSFGDRMHVSRLSNVYTKNGFQEHSVSAPDYCYLKDKRRVHKFNMRKSNFKALGFDIEGKTEEQLRIEAKLPKIWDAGKICYVKTYR